MVGALAAVGALALAALIGAVALGVRWFCRTVDEAMGTIGR